MNSVDREEKETFLSLSHNTRIRGQSTKLLGRSFQTNKKRCFSHPHIICLRSSLSRQMWC